MKCFANQGGIKKKKFNLWHKKTDITLKSAIQVWKLENTRQWGVTFERKRRRLVKDRQRKHKSWTSDNEKRQKDGGSKVRRAACNSTLWLRSGSVYVPSLWPPRHTEKPFRVCSVEQMLYRAEHAWPDQQCKIASYYHAFKARLLTPLKFSMKNQQPNSTIPAPNIKLWLI